MPLLFSLGIQNAFEEVRQSLEDGECLFVPQQFDVLSSPKRMRVICDLLATTLGERAGIQLHIGKTRTWNFAGECPVDNGRARTQCLELESRSSALLWGMTNSWRTSSRNGWQRSKNCGTQSPQSQTCNVRGRCSSSAQGLDVIICCAGFHHDSMQDVRMGTILGCSARWKHCREDPRKPNAGRDGTQHHHSTHEDGRSRFEVCREDGARCILGFMG